MSRSSLLDGQSTDRCAVVLVDAGSNEDNVDGDPFEYAQLGVAHVRALVKQLSQQLRLGLHPCQSNDCALHDAEYDDHDHDDDTREGVEWTAEASTAQTATTSSPPRSGCTALLLPPVGQQTSAAVHLCAVLTFFAVAVTPSVGPFWPLAVSIAPAQAPKVASSSSSVSSFSSSFSSPLSSSLESAREVSVSSSLPIPSQLPSAMISTESPTRNPTPTPTPMAPGEQASSINPAIELPATQSAEFPLKSPAVQQLIAAMPARFVFDASTAREALTTIRAAVLHSESVSNLRDCAASLTFLPLQPPNFQVGTPLHLPVQLADMDVARLCAALPSMHGVCILHHSCRTVRAFDPALAYLMSTSGSTGTPKVVLVPSTAIATNVSELAATLPGGADDRMLAVAPPTFDPFIIEIALACIRDATLVIPAYSIRRNPQKLARLISEGGIHWLQCTPSLLAQLSQQERLAILDSSLRTLILGGEPFPAWLLRFLFTNQERLYSSLSVWNIYGTTECSVWSTAFQLDVSILSQGLLDAFEHSLPIGNPLPQSCIELRDLQDSSLVLCHICGSAVHHSRIATLAERDGSSTLCGQLWLGGPARGCRLLSEAESELSQHGMRDSGDQAEAVFDESAPSTFPRILFRGRRDRTIKRFGQRVSLDAIESWLRSLHVLQSFQTVALVYDDPFLTLVLSTGLERQQSAASLTDDFNARALLSHIALVAPQPAMAPDRLHVLRAPCALTPSGKVDMIALKRLIDKDTQSDCPKNAPTSREALCQALEAACPHRINELHHAFVHSTACRWLDAGLSSFDLVRLAAAVSDLFATVDKAAVLESMFHGTFEDLCRELMPTLPTNVLQRGQKRSLDESPPSSIRVPRLESSNSRRIGVACGCVYSRASKSRVNPACRHAPLDGPASAWTFDFSKCIDASPLVLLSNQKPFVAIGSHDHHFALIELQSGNLCWKTLLPDRIESSACLSPDGTLLVVGLYILTDAIKMQPSYRTHG
ncbi:hypothetical protein, variant [Capsaspora owczarzaki ATCC 30864]|uniref:hypothetical protein, variant n=1 Tax=Capsaspora owczarzaki (strain ATCC 30864) TaxID=595528 RepID=UPI0003524DF1|nr:hypothetical protein, variant [Capsaspora owczarzaki ATCC 30864]|eukprot:XP_011270780.1 hypothetical protein, variant [Capsaspora owczarzaki ATCC 30864]